MLERICKFKRFGYSFVETKEDCLKLIHEMIHENDVVSVGGSVSLGECGILEYLENRKDITYLDRYHCEDPHKVFHDAFNADVYLTSSNAITKQGELYNVDATGNRVAAMIYGPKKVIVVLGKNKIVENLDEAIKQTEIAAYKNNIRLKKDNPCIKVGHCVQCDSPTKLCRYYTVIESSQIEGRIHIILVNEDLGY